MSKKHKKKKDLFDQALQAFLIQENESLEQDSQFEWDSFDIEEDFNQDERQPPPNEEYEDGSLQSDLSRYAEDISEEDFDEVSSGFLNNVCGPQKKVESRVTDDINGRSCESHNRERSFQAHRQTAWNSRNKISRSAA